MSRIGKKPIVVPAGVTITTKGGEVEVKGPRGQLTQRIPSGISVVVEGTQAEVHRRDDSKQQRAFHGLVRSLVQNMVTGVSAGFKVDLDVIGVGYKAEVKEQALHLALGYSHPIVFDIPPGITITVEKGKKKISNYAGTISVEGIDRQRVGQVAADIRAKRKPDSYKGKGVRYADEVVKLKESKKTA